MDQIDGEEMLPDLNLVQQERCLISISCYYAPLGWFGPT
ncbi:hypothetical protein BRADI_4g18836v3 [Brachypodium distachyon]|uniref:Uncharacterized protein n=1 Tax=Brachypodium distachyon TaxID=15368 RepID=A0A2K2CNK8_BRADI|nr:hypothetical protein BRADI_4g18836v3 [Brachypodium distachyon]